MNIDVKRNSDGDWFYSFAIEKGSVPQTLLAAGAEKSTTLPNKIIPQNGLLSSENDTQKSLSSISNSFYGNSDMTTTEFLEPDYKQTEGYQNYVDSCLNNMRQTRPNFNEAVARKEIEDSVDGIVRVAMAAKAAGYDIYDDNSKRDVKDSKNIQPIPI